MMTLMDDDTPRTMAKSHLSWLAVLFVGLGVLGLVSWSSPDASEISTLGVASHGKGLHSNAKSKHHHTSVAASAKVVAESGGKLAPQTLKVVKEQKVVDHISEELEKAQEKLGSLTMKKLAALKVDSLKARTSSLSETKPAKTQSLSAGSVLDEALKKQAQTVHTLSDLLADAEKKMDKRADVIIDTVSTATPGPAGPQGKQGPKGRKGESGVPGAQGPEGAPGGPGPVGDQGQPGKKGFRGETGETGPRGKPGFQGAVGAPGYVGPVGARGEAGEQGPQGAKGANGMKGTQGAVGAVGASGGHGVQGQKGAKKGKSVLLSSKQASDLIPVMPPRDLLRPVLPPRDPLAPVQPPTDELPRESSSKGARPTQLSLQARASRAPMDAVAVARAVAVEEQRLKNMAKRLAFEAGAKAWEAKREEGEVDRVLAPILEPKVEVEEKDVPVEERIVQHPIIQEKRIVERPVIRVVEPRAQALREERDEREVEALKHELKQQQLVMRARLKALAKQRVEAQKQATQRLVAAEVAAAAKHAQQQQHGAQQHVDGGMQKQRGPGYESASQMENDVAHLRGTLDSLLHKHTAAAGGGDLVQGARREDARARAALRGLAGVAAGAAPSFEPRAATAVSRHAAAALGLAREAKGLGATLLGEVDGAHAGVKEGLLQSAEEKERKMMANLGSELAHLKGAKAAALRARLARIEASGN